MAEDHHARIHDGADLVRHGDAAFQLDGVHVRFLIEAQGVFHRVLGADVVGAEGHIADQVGVGRAPAHGLGMGDGDVHGHRHRAGIAVDDHTHGVAA